MGGGVPAAGARGRDAGRALLAFGVCVVELWLAQVDVGFPREVAHLGSKRTFGYKGLYAPRVSAECQGRRRGVLRRSILSPRGLRI